MRISLSGADVPPAAGGRGWIKGDGAMLDFRSKVMTCPIERGTTCNTVLGVPFSKKLKNKKLQ